MQTFGVPLKRGRDRAYCWPPFLFSIGGAGRAVSSAFIAIFSSLDASQYTFVTLKF